MPLEPPVLILHHLINLMFHRFAIILVSGDHFTINTRHLLGAQAQRRAQLEQLGFTIIEVRIFYSFNFFVHRALLDLPCHGYLLYFWDQLVPWH